ncbi:MAG: hypothetical protein H9802_09735 [Candidatus Phocaeicola faecipullorum]|nr:hypothetical protein [Candidatus Phocaeicola faecipullorum]
MFLKKVPMKFQTGHKTIGETLHEAMPPSGTESKKPFEIFTVIHNSINLVRSEGSHFNQ